MSWSLYLFDSTAHEPTRFLGRLALGCSILKFALEDQSDQTHLGGKEARVLVPGVEASPELGLVFVSRTELAAFLRESSGDNFRHARKDEQAFDGSY